MTYRRRLAQAEGYLTVHDEKYGYFLNEERKGFFIDEEVAPIIREIFYLLSEKEIKYSEVAALMNERGYESPMKHLARVGQKNIPDCRSHWGLYSVQRIAQNTAYIGYWYKMVDGERKKLEIPPIVPKEQFDRIAQRYELSPNKHHGEERSKNAFVKQIFDKETGTPLVCRLHRAEKPYQTFSLEFWDQDRIEYDYVMEEAVAALFAEQELAQTAGKLVDTKMCADELNRRKEVLGEKARLLFAEMVEVEQKHIPLYCQKENGEISETEYIRQRTEIFEVLAEQEKEFAKLMEQVQMLETAFSRGNPWIQFYSKIEITDVLEKAQVRKWIDRLLITNCETVEVVFPEKYMKWKDILPSQWFMAVLIKNVSTFQKTKPAYDTYRKARNKDRYRAAHEGTVILHEAAAKALKAAGISKLPNLAALQAEYEKLQEQKEALRADYGKLKKQVKEYDVIKQNIDSILRQPREPEREKGKERE